MGPAVLITLGVLFLLDQVTHVYWMEFGRTWPALLIVIGLIMFLQHNAPATGHVPREYMAMPPAQPATAMAATAVQPQQWQPPGAAGRRPAAGTSGSAAGHDPMNRGGAQWLAHIHTIGSSAATSAGVPLPAVAGRAADPDRHRTGVPAAELRRALAGVALLWALLAGADHPVGRDCADRTLHRAASTATRRVAWAAVESSC